MTEVVRILAGLLLWLAAFSAVYALHGLGCAQGWEAIPAGPVSLARLLLLVAWLLAALAQLALLAALRSARLGAELPFVRRISLATAWIGLVATVWTLQPVATTSACL